MAGFFNGWIGYGTSVQSLVLQEPVDPGYGRRPINFSAIENGFVADLTGGTVGPSTLPWGTLTTAGLFDSASGGNLLITFIMATPMSINQGVTYTVGPGLIRFLGIGRSTTGQTHCIPTGGVLASTADGQSIIANLPLQVVNGVLSAQKSAFGSTVMMPVLPAQAPVSGSGQLWNNGGIISVS